jgi:ABC-2 type transport system permease protein
MTGVLSSNRASEVTFARVLRSEWIKFRTLPSTWWTLGAAVAAMVVFGAVIGSGTADRMDADPWELTPAAMMRGYYIAQLLVGVLGALLVSSEYATGMIRATLTAVPARAKVLAAKAVLFTAIGSVVMTVAAFGAFVASQAFIDPAYHLDVGADGVWQAVLGTGAYLTFVGLLGGALGWVLRSTPGAISALVGLVLVAPLLLQIFSSDLASDISRFLPSELAISVSSVAAQPGPLGAGEAALGLIGWLAVAAVGAAAMVRSRDA